MEVILMKRTVELDTVEIADKLGELASKVSMLGLAASRDAL
jgi:hypothetical protein